jgi:TPR repeat protein
MGSGLIYATREAWRDPRLEVDEQVSQQVPGQVVSKRVPEQLTKPAPTAPYRLLHRALLGLTIVVVFVVLGYLVGPMLDKRWADSAQASQRSVAEAASTGSGQSATDHSPQAKILTDLLKLADQGDADAQWQMGVRYHNGEGVPHDDAQATQWFLRAAEQGHVNAQATLGAYYWEGRGVPRDLSKAYFWSAIALTEGDMNSKSRLEGLASQMTQEQVSDTLQQAEVWIRTHSQRAKSKAS